MRKVCLALSLLFAHAALALAAPAENPWPRFVEPAPGPARAIGDYSAGCLQGAEALSLDGVGYQVMRPSRKRYFGHPLLIEFVRTLGRRVHAQKLGALLVGDLSQPRGGRAAMGHASHQTGLDVDLWYASPERARKVPLTLVEREQMAAPSVVDPKTESLRRDQKKRVAALLRLAAEDARVERVFVNPAIKRTLCESARGADWLRKVRPWYGHDDHFHVRLACPAGEGDCKAQAPLPEGDGCDKLSFWFDRSAQTARKQARKDYQESVRNGRGWPERCDALLETSAL